MNRQGCKSPFLHAALAFVHMQEEMCCERDLFYWQGTPSSLPMHLHQVLYFFQDFWPKPFFICKVRTCALGLRCCSVRQYILSCQYLLLDLEISAIIFLLLTPMTSGHFLNCLWSRTLHCLVSTCHWAPKLCLLLCPLFLILLLSWDWRQFIVIPHCVWENAGLCLSPHVLFSLLCYFHQSLFKRSYEYVSSYITGWSFKKVSSEWDDRSVSEVLALQAGGPQGHEPASKEAEHGNMCS